MEASGKMDGSPSTQQSSEDCEQNPPDTILEAGNSNLIKQEVKTLDEPSTSYPESTHFTSQLMKCEDGKLSCEGIASPGLLQTNHSSSPIRSDLSTRIKEEACEEENNLVDPLHICFQIKEEICEPSSDNEICRGNYHVEHTSEVRTRDPSNYVPTVGTVEYGYDSFEPLMRLKERAQKTIDEPANKSERIHPDPFSPQLSLSTRIKSETDKEDDNSVDPLHTHPEIDNGPHLKSLEVDKEHNVGDNTNNASTCCPIFVSVDGGNCCVQPTLLPAFVTPMITLTPSADEQCVRGNEPCGFGNEFRPTCVKVPKQKRGRPKKPEAEKKARRTEYDRLRYLAKKGSHVVETWKSLEEGTERKRGRPKKNPAERKARKAEYMRLRYLAKKGSRDLFLAEKSESSEEVAAMTKKPGRLKTSAAEVSEARTHADLNDER